MNSVIISEEKVIDLSKLCLSNLRNMVNDEYFLGFNEVKRLRTLFFLACQKVFNEQKKINELHNKESDEVWNEKLEEKFCKASMITEKSKVGDYETKIEEIFKTPVFEEYSREKFSLKEIERIIYLIEKGINKCNELCEDLYYQIKDFKYIYYVYNCGHLSLNCDFIFK